MAARIVADKSSIYKHNSGRCRSRDFKQYNPYLPSLIGGLMRSSRVPFPPSMRTSAAGRAEELRGIGAYDPGMKLRASSSECETRPPVLVDALKRIARRGLRGRVRVLLRLLRHVLDRRFHAADDGLQDRQSSFRSTDVVLDCRWTLLPQLRRERTFAIHQPRCYATWASAHTYFPLRPCERLLGI